MNVQNIKKMKAEKGFTIVELLIVIVVIGILAAIVIVAYNGVTSRAKATKANAAASTLIKKLEAYNADQGLYPTTYGTLTNTSNSAQTWYTTGLNITGTAIGTTAPSNEATVNYYSCTSPAGVRVTYWNYAATPAATADMYSGGATSGSSCTIVAS